MRSLTAFLFAATVLLVAPTLASAQMPNIPVACAIETKTGTVGFQSPTASPGLAQAKILYTKIGTTTPEVYKFVLAYEEVKPGQIGSLKEKVKKTFGKFTVTCEYPGIRGAMHCGPLKETKTGATSSCSACGRANDSTRKRCYTGTFTLTREQ